MMCDEVMVVLVVGVVCVCLYVLFGMNVIGFGEMGIVNMLLVVCLMSCLFDVLIDVCVGCGMGFDD